MSKRFTEAIAAGILVVFMAGTSVYAQDEKPVKRDLAQKRAGMQQKLQDRRPGAPDRQPGARDKVRDRIHARMGSLTAMFMPISPEVAARLAVRHGLSDQQKQTVKQLYQQFGAKVKPIRERRQSDLKALMVAFRNPNATKEELQRLSEPVLQADRAILDAEFDFWVAFRDVLTPEQQARISSLMAKRAERFPAPGKQQGAKDGNPAVPAR